MNRVVASGWERQHHRPGEGQAFLFYVVFGEFPEATLIEGLPAGFAATRHLRAENRELFETWFTQYLGRVLAEEQPPLALKVRSADSLVLIRGEFPDPGDLEYLRVAIQLVTATLGRGGFAVLDPQSFRWWSREEWELTIAQPDKPLPRNHVTILLSPEDQHPGTTWVHTRGMRKFGRPDISIHDVRPEQEKAILDLCNRFIELQAFGGIIPEGQEIRMKTLPAGLSCTHGGSLDDPAFNNVHVEIRGLQP